MSNPDAVSRKLIGTQGGKRRLSTLLALKDAKKRNTRLDNPSREEMRECIKDQWCWWCDKGPWKNLAAHTSKAHFIMAADIRELAYLFKTAVICSPEHSLVASIHFKKLEGMGLLNRRPGQAARPHILSTAGHDAVVALSKIQIRKPAFRKAFTEQNELQKRPHLCGVCGTLIPTSKPIHCSPECSHIAHSESCSRAMTPERIARFNAIRRPPEPEEQSRRVKEYWRKFKELPPEEQRRLNLERASSRRVRIYKDCVICGATFDVIPSQAKEAVTCRRPKCKKKNQSIKAIGRRHTPEAIAKMSAHAKQRHVKEPLFGSRR